MLSKTGKGNIKATIIKDSINISGDRITTFELEYHRFIHSELMTHRMFSRNAMSSRAVPIDKMIEQVRNNPATPIHWGANRSGMQAYEECTNLVLDFVGEEFSVEEWWKLSAEEAADSAECLAEAGYHKQIVNRILEPYQFMKTIVTATEFDNFFELRCHKDAQPEIQELANLMEELYEASEPQLLESGQWHLPYVSDELLTSLSVEDALKVSASCCAQVSYRLLDDSVEKALKVYDRLVSSEPIHASPFEHQAKSYPQVFNTVKMYPSLEGATSYDNSGNYWSGNFKGWIQYRQLL